MKKNIRLLFFIILVILFNIFLCREVFAKATINATVFYSKGSTTTIASYQAFPGLNCGGKNIGEKYDGSVYSYTKDKIKLYYASGYYVAKITEKFDKSEIVTMTCTYDEAHLEYGNVNSPSINNDGNNTLTINITVLNPDIRDWSVDVTLHPKMGDVNFYALGNGSIFSKTIYDRWHPEDNQEIDSDSIEFGSNHYLTAAIQGEGDTVAVVVSVPNADSINPSNKSKLYDIIKFKYKYNKKNYSITYNVTLSYENSIFAKAEPDLCDMKGWTKVLDNGVVNVPISPDAYSNLQDVFKKKYKAGDKITLPTCKDDTEHGRFFKGWYYVPGGRGETLDSETCGNGKVQLYTGTVDVDVIRSGEDADGAVGTLVTCQALVPYVMLNVTNSTIPKSEKGWSLYAPDTTNNTYVHYFTDDSDDSITLPKKLNVESSGSVKMEFRGWAKDVKDCSDDYNNTEIVVKKSEIGAGVEYSACYTYKGVLEDGGTPDGDEGHKTMFIGTTVSAKSSYFEDGTGVFSVEKKYQEYITAECDEYNNCYLTAHKKTDTNDDGNYKEIPVTVTGKYNDNPNFRIVYMYKVIGNEGQVISLEGEEYTIEGFAYAGQEVNTTCGKYEVSVDSNTAREKGVDIMAINGVTLRAHFYTVEAQCKGDNSIFKAVCLDPGREEPNLKDEDAGLYGSWYYKDNSIDPVNNYVDRITTYLYNSKSSNFTIDGKKSYTHLAAAEFILRLVAIETGDDKNNKSAGLREYYKAYKKVADNMNSYIKKKNKGKEVKNLSKWPDYMKKPANMTDSDYKTFFCNGSCNIPTTSKTIKTPDGNVGTKGIDVVKMAYKYLYYGLQYKQTRGFSPSITVNKTETKWKDDNKESGEYVKVVEGKLSGLNNPPEGAFLDLALVCEECNDADGVTAKLYVGRDANHLVKYYAQVNYLTVKYKEFTGRNDWYKGGGDKAAYSDKTLLSDTGTIYFEYVITGKIETVADHADYGDGSGDNSDGTGTGGGHNVHLAVGDDQSGGLIDIGVVMPAQSINIQRMVMFSRTSDPTERTIDGSPGGGGSGNGGEDGRGREKVYTAPPSQVTINYKPPTGGEPRSIRLVYRTIEVATVYPSCDFEVFNHNKTKGTGDYFKDDMFKLAGCCSFELDETSTFYKNVCASTCAFSSFSSVCKPGTGSGGSVAGTEVLNVNEGVKFDGSPNMTCVYSDSGGDKKDSAGNTFRVFSNSLCSVYCKEDWEFVLPDFNNHVGANAVKAGLYFEIRHDQINISGKRTCVTSKIDIDDWKSDLNSLSYKLVGAFNCLIKQGAGPAIVKKGDFDNPALKFEGDKGEYSVEVVGASACPETSHTGDGYRNVSGPKVKKKGDKTCYESWEEKDTDTWCNATTCANKKLTVNEKGCCSKTDWDDKEATDIEATKCKYKFTTKGSYSVISMTWNGGIGFRSDTATGTYTTEEIEMDGKCDENKAPDAATLEELKKESILAATSNAGCIPGNMGGIKEDIKEKVRDMHQCQKFEVVAEGKQGRITSGSKVIKDTDIALSIVDIMSVFDPKINYSYDDIEGMSKIGSNNDIQKLESSVKWTEGNEIYIDDDFKKNEYEGKKADLKDSSGQAIGEANDKGYKFAHCTLGGSGTGVSGGSKSKELSGGGGHVYHWTAEPDCYEREAPYIPDAYYIKRYIGYTADYVKEKNWYADRLSDYKEFATSKDEAVKLTKSNNKNKDLWVRLGTAENSDLVFPVSNNTPRGLYKYQFIYTNVGMYNNTGLVGRIMGGNNSVVPNNKRTCFYEVVEEICTCCGDVVSYVAQIQENEDIVETSHPGDNETLYDFYDPRGGPGQYGIDTDAVLKCKNGKCDYDTASLAASNIIVSPVALGTIKKNISNTGRGIGVNWTKNTQYILDGELYITDKGGYLLEKLDGQAETIYNQPEYSYTLSPSALSNIRTLNSASGYQPRTDTFTSVPERGIKINTDGSSWLVGKSEESVGFTHLKSKFLESVMKQYITPGVGVINTDDTCYVLAKDYKDDTGNGFKIVHKDGVNGTTSYIKGNKYQCRWIDYVGDTKKVGSTKLPDGIKEKYRMPFK